MELYWAHTHTQKSLCVQPFTIHTEFTCTTTTKLSNLPKNTGRNLRHPPTHLSEWWSHSTQAVEGVSWMERDRQRERERDKDVERDSGCGRCELLEALSPSAHQAEEYFCVMLCCIFSPWCNGPSVRIFPLLCAALLLSPLQPPLPSSLLLTYRPPLLLPHLVDIGARRTS